MSDDDDDTNVDDSGAAVFLGLGPAGGMFLADDNGDFLRDGDGNYFNIG